MTTVARISACGEITLPKDVMEALHLDAGDVLNIEGNGTHQIIPKTLHGRDVAGMLAGKSAAGSTIEEMDVATAVAFRNEKRLCHAAVRAQRLDFPHAVPARR